MSGNLHSGVLFEIGPLGTGFLEDLSTGRVLAFHPSFLGLAAKPTGLTWHEWLEGQSVQYRLEDGTLASVALKKSASA